MLLFAQSEQDCVLSLRGDPFDSCSYCRGPPPMYPAIPAVITFLAGAVATTPADDSQDTRLTIQIREDAPEGMPLGQLPLGTARLSNESLTTLNTTSPFGLDPASGAVPASRSATGLRRTPVVPPDVHDCQGKTCRPAARPLPQQPQEFGDRCGPHRKSRADAQAA